MDAFQQHWGLYFLREICLIFVINCKMIFCSSSSLMPVDENAHCTNALLGGRQVFFLTVIEVQWSSELILLKLFVRPPCVLGTLGLSARGWADLNWFVPAEGGGGTIYILSQRSGLPHFVRAIVEISTRRWMKSWSWSWSREMGNLHPVWDQVKKYGLARDEKYKRGILMKIFC